MSRRKKLMHEWGGMGRNPVREADEDYQLECAIAAVVVDVASAEPAIARETARAITEKLTKRLDLHGAVRRLAPRARPRP